MADTTKSAGTSRWLNCSRDMFSKLTFYLVSLLAFSAKHCGYLFLMHHHIVILFSIIIVKVTFTLHLFLSKEVYLVYFRHEWRLAPVLWGLHCTTASWGSFYSNWGPPEKNLLRIFGENENLQSQYIIFLLKLIESYTNYIWSLRWHFEVVIRLLLQ